MRGIVMTNIHKDISLSIDGLGLALYSDAAMQYVEEGADFFTQEFSTPEQVVSHIQKGDIVGFCTGSGGDYCLRFREGYPDSETDAQYPVSIRLALHVKGNTMSVIDLAWLMEWSAEVPEEQQLHVEEGYYHLTILTRLPSSGIRGDQQTIYIYMQKLEEMPALRWNGIPQLYEES